MIRKIFIALVSLSALLVAAGYFLPAGHHVERSVDIERPAATVFTLLNSYRSFNSWSPWAERDPGASYVHGGPASGVGARLEWSGDPRQVGTGWQEITLSRPFERIEVHLDFGSQGEADSYYEITPVPGGARLTWGFDTDVTQGRGFFGALAGRYFGLFLDRWVGSDYSAGLSRFKALVESLPEADFGDADISVLEVEPVPILYVQSMSGQDAESVATALGAAFGEVTAFLVASDVRMNGQPMAITRAWDETGYHFDAALPVDALPEDPGGNIETGMSPGGLAVRIVHRGPYDRILDSYEKLAAYMAAHSLEQGALSWEHYISDPGSTQPEDLITHVYFQLAE